MMATDVRLRNVNPECFYLAIIAVGTVPRDESLRAGDIVNVNLFDLIRSILERL